ncbi:MotA/TolQ/ExbB proton channel family protein [Dinoroseobacter sp. PD6]|uniref:MotA/TolQ/ExbB proton channel family protein n=1 Tax=Dinoroseobacter sp. PD6 TaxID=3028384 RepID=UPI00237BC5C9|nr:MotA/TolQ/ExbB proton channel family protein [Dinoroseobacter sp. PD6]MDD9717520.1 MotA/TolQ/ExbB proton channel family protein [Dinoroseobacter sp. PD6]
MIDLASLSLLDLSALQSFMGQGGPAIWVIAGLSVITLTVILWKLWRFARIGAWSGQRADRAVQHWVKGDMGAAHRALSGQQGVRARLVARALAALDDPGLSFEGAKEETYRIAQRELAQSRAGLRVLELIATIAPLIGLLGTVLGMIAAFQALQDAGARADPGTLAGGIWEALLTTAAGMAVAIPASMALSYFESVVDRIRQDMEDLATRIFIRAETRELTPKPLQQAAE